MLVGGITCDREMFIFMCFPGFTFHHNTNVISVKATGEELLSYGLYQPWDLTSDTATSGNYNTYIIMNCRVR